MIHPLLKLIREFKSLGALRRTYPSARKEPPSTRSRVKSVTSNPPSGAFRVTNMYVDSRTNKIIIDYDNTPQR